NSTTYLGEYVHPAVTEGLQASRRSRADFTFASSTLVVIGDTPQELAQSRQAVRQQIAFYASTRTYEPVLAAHARQDRGPPPPSARRRRATRPGRPGRTCP